MENREVVASAEAPASPLKDAWITPEVSDHPVEALTEVALGPPGSTDSGIYS